jgi:SAM-dependent methyltransferase
MPDQRVLWEAIYADGSPDRGGTEPSEFCKRFGLLLSGPSDILEIGCGPGHEAAYLSALGHRVIATDLAANAVIAAHDRYPISDRLRFEQHDAAEPFDLNDGSLDAVYARLSLQYFDHTTTRAILAEIARVLRTSGLVAIMGKSVDDPLYGKGTMVEPDVFDHDHRRHFFSERYARQVLADAFDIVSIEAKQGALYGSPSAWIEVIACRKPIRAARRRGGFRWWPGAQRQR